MKRLLVAIVTVVFSDVLFLGRAFYFRDITRFYYPLRKLLSTIVLTGEFPSWNPLWAAGQPLAANPNYGVFYPPQWLIFLPGFDFWFRFLMVLHVGIAAVGAYLLLRCWTRTEAALFGAIVFALGGLTLSLINLPPFLYCLAWLPWIALAIERRRFAVAAFLLALSIVGGEPVTIAQVCVLISAFALIRKVSWHRVVFVVALGTLAASVQLLPAIDLLRDSVRSRGFPFGLVGQWSTPPARFVDLFIPQFSGAAAEHFRLYWGTAKYGWLDPFFVGIYFGLIPIALALAGLTVRLPGWRWVTAAMTAGVILSVGSHTPILRLLYSVRLFSSFRYPEKFLVLVLVPLMFFSAIAFDRADGRIVRRALVICVVTVIACALLLGASFHPAYASRFVAVWGIAIHPLAAEMVRASRSVWMVALIRSAVAGAAVLLMRRRPSIAILVVALDLGYERLSIAETIGGDFFRTAPAAAQKIDGRVRVFHQADWYGATFTARRYLDLPEMYWVLRNGLYPMAGAVWNVPVAMNRDIDESFLTPATDFNAALIELRRRNAPRWFEPLMAMSGAGYRAMYLPFHRTGDPKTIDPIIFVPQRTNPVFYFADPIPCRSLAEFIDGVPNVSMRAAFADIPPFTPAAATVIATRQRSHSAEVNVDATGKALLVVSITRHKYWRATIDGRDAQLIPINIQYQGVMVPAGRHTIRMTYRNPLFIYGGAISVASLGLLFVMMLRERNRVEEKVVEAPLELAA
ncbi:MAG TPA: YfhO family protein [Thermoanaerobaculia bacterium]|nr:YfhO family protein [Thermoanaerobaculia bacterium]